MNTSHYPSLELCKKLTEAVFPETEKLMDIKGRIIGNEIGIIEDYVCPSVMELLDFIRTNNISLLGNGVINFLSPELPDALAELAIDYLIK